MLPAAACCPSQKEIRPKLSSELYTQSHGAQATAGISVSEDGQEFVRHREMLSVSLGAVAQLAGPLRGHGAGRAVGHQTRSLLGEWSPAAGNVQLFPGGLVGACDVEIVSVGGSRSIATRERTAVPHGGSAPAPTLERAGEVPRLHIISIALLMESRAEPAGVGRAGGRAEAVQLMKPDPFLHSALQKPIRFTSIH